MENFLPIRSLVGQKYGLSYHMVVSHHSLVYILHSNKATRRFLKSYPTQGGMKVKNYTVYYIDRERQDGGVSNLPEKAADDMNPKKEAIALFERLQKLGNLVALTFIVIAQFVTQAIVPFFTIWVSVLLGGRNLAEEWAYRVARVKAVL